MSGLLWSCLFDVGRDPGTPDPCDGSATAARALLVAAMVRLRPDADPDRVGATAFLIWQLGEATMRLAVSHGPAEGAALVEAFKRMTVRELAML